MESFKDSKNVSRLLSLTIGKARKCGKLFDIDFLDGEPTAICRDLLIRKVLQVDLIWFLLDNKDGIELIEGETDQESFETNHLDAQAFEKARVALFAEIENFIQSVRPEMAEIVKETILLITTEITENAKLAASLFQSTEVKEGFSKANADAMKKLQKQISNEFSKLAEDSESTPIATP